MRLLKAFSFKLVLSFGAAAGAMLALGACAIMSEPLEKETRAVQVDHVAASALKVRTENGAIDAKADPGGAAKVVITAEVRAQTKERLAAAKIVTTRAADGSLTIEVAWPEGGRKSNEGCDFNITLPDAKGIDLQTSNGRISASGFSGSAVAHTSNGAIVVSSQAGPVEAQTSNGSVTIKDVQGSAIARSSNGAIVISGASAVSADTSNGSITLTLGPSFAGSLKLDTSNGSVTLHNAEGVKVVSMQKTSAEVQAGDVTSQRSHASTSNGHVEVTFGK